MNRCEQCPIANQISYHGKKARQNAANRLTFAESIDPTTLDSHVAEQITDLLNQLRVLDEECTLAERLAEVPDDFRQQIADIIVTNEFSDPANRDRKTDEFTQDTIILNAIRRIHEIPRNFSTCAGECSLLQEPEIDNAWAVTNARNLEMIIAEQNDSASE